MPTALAIMLCFLLGPGSSEDPAPSITRESKRESSIAVTPPRNATDPTMPLARLDRWLDRPAPPSARFLEHGVIELGIAGGTPHLYRLELLVGLFDVASVGVTAHWLPGQAWPQVWPIGALRFWHGRLYEIGAHYRPVLFPPVDESRFTPQAHFALASFTLGDGWFTAALDAGAAHLRLPSFDPAKPTDFRRETVFGGGFVVRVGNEWIGLSADCLAAVHDDPLLVFEAKLDLRWDLRRPAGGWPTRARRPR